VVIVDERYGAQPAPRRAPVAPAATVEPRRAPAQTPATAEPTRAPAQQSTMSGPRHARASAAAVPEAGVAPAADQRFVPLSTPRSDPEAPPLAPAAPFSPSIAARDARQGPAAWIGSIGAQLAAFERDGRPFGVLLIEMLEPAALDARDATHALEERLGQWRGLTLTREGPGRYWLLAPGADRAGAESLRDLVESPRGEARGGPVAVGIALCPEDGRDAAGLAAHADLDLYSSRSRSAERRAGRS
jgi:hypothetical protein